ncbi:hypothetical protein LP085_03595 [Achromobacter sp. MY14]|uniref:hypothetical protein n=1 Tax=unclassified Achromobacter TaxID=2626865 RepID=UPI001E4F7C38|nr:hypothetical protein [Achromobacter sp. MY14]MCD0495927.1 hypothetical protein [Achromobacter sp. MY14]
MSAVSHVGLVKNPLTIIAMFAVIAEVSGAVVLPFLSERVQATYVWFLMLFPFLLVVLFFVTLWAKRDALYGPSDFRDEKHFMDALMRKATVSELAIKVATDTAAALLDSVNGPAEGVLHQPQEDGGGNGSNRTPAGGANEIPPRSGEPSAPEGGKGPTAPVDFAQDEASVSDKRFLGVMKRREFMKNIALMEASSRFKQVQYNMKVGDLVVDAVAVSKESISLIETHYVGSAGLVRSALADLTSVLRAAKEFLESSDTNAPLRVLFVVYSEHAEILENVAGELRRRVAMHKFSAFEIEIKTTPINKLALATLS